MIRRLRRAGRRTIDRALTALILVIAELELAFQTEIDGAYVPMAITLGASVATLLWRRSHPLPAGAAMLGGWIFMNVALADVDNLQTPLIAVLVMSYSMGAHTSGRAVPASAAIVFAGMLGVVATWDEQVFTDYVFPTGFALVAWLAGRGSSPARG